MFLGPIQTIKNSIDFLQSDEWADFQKSLNREVLEYNKEGIAAKVVRHDMSFGKNYLYIPHGPVVDFNSMTGGTKNLISNFVRWLREEATKRKSIFVKAEPLTDSVAQALAEHGFKKSRKEIQPSRTVVIDLAKSEAELLSAMHHKTRYNIGVAEKHGVEVKENDDFESFWKLLKKTTKRDRFHPHSKDYYQKLLGYFKPNNKIQTKLFLAYQDVNPIAGAIILIYKNTVHYLHGASDYNYRSLMAPHALHWSIIRYLKTTHYPLLTAHYDLWGIDPRKWPGVTRFKLGWGGQTVERPGSFDLPVSRFWYFLYRIAKKT